MSKPKQLFLGKKEDGFIPPLRETDERFLSASRDFESVGLAILSLQDEIKEMKADALDPIKDELKEYVSRLDAMEHLYTHRRIAQSIEEARIRSVEENATFVVFVISQKLTKLTDWCYVNTKKEYRGKCEFYGTLNVHKVAEYDCGEMLVDSPSGTEQGAA